MFGCVSNLNIIYVSNKSRDIKHFSYILSFRMKYASQRLECYKIFKTVFFPLT